MNEEHIKKKIKKVETETKELKKKLKSMAASIENTSGLLKPIRKDPTTSFHFHKKKKRHTLTP